MKDKLHVCCVSRVTLAPTVGYDHQFEERKKNNFKGAMRDPMGVAWDKFVEVKVFFLQSITVIILMTI